jgi:thiamine biosynthesis protein ThiI
VRGPGGLPVGVAGKGILLLSGGIDSPVSGYLMAKRGLAIDAVYYHTYPYSPDETLEKVKTIVEKLAGPCCGINLYVVPFTDVALKIRNDAPSEQTTLLMRAGMMDVASRIAVRQKALCLVTGESLSQVASQTAQSMRFTGSTSRLPVFRPLIALDKEEIVAIAQRIGTFETSILPFDDCCTIFSPDKPLIRPHFQRMQESYEGLDLERLLVESIGKIEKFWYPPGI